MAKLKVYSVWDDAIKLYSKPFYALTQGQALRGWIDICNDKNSEFNKHPDSYTLFELGEFDEELGTFQNHSTPESLGIASKYKNPS